MEARAAAATTSDASAYADHFYDRLAGGPPPSAPQGHEWCEFLDRGPAGAQGQTDVAYDPRYITSVPAPLQKSNSKGKGDSSATSQHKRGRDYDDHYPTRSSSSKFNTSQLPEDYSTSSSLRFNTGTSHRNGGRAGEENYASSSSSQFNTSLRNGEDYSAHSSSVLDDRAATSMPTRNNGSLARKELISFPRNSDQSSGGATAAAAAAAAVARSTFDSGRARIFPTPSSLSAAAPAAAAPSLTAADSYMGSVAQRHAAVRSANEGGDWADFL